jgi:hypothetical protein
MGESLRSELTVFRGDDHRLFWRPGQLSWGGDILAGQRGSTMVSAVGRHSTPGGQKFPLPPLISDDKIQIPALPHFNAGI